jgi:hypothetical protein
MFTICVAYSDIFEFKLMYIFLYEWFEGLYVR